MYKKLKDYQDRVHMLSRTIYKTQEIDESVSTEATELSALGKQLQVDAYEQYAHNFHIENLLDEIEDFKYKVYGLDFKESAFSLMSGAISLDNALENLIETLGEDSDD